MQQRGSSDSPRPQAPSSFREWLNEKFGSDADVDRDAICAAGGGGAAQVSGPMMSSVKQALEEGGCDKLATARVLNLLEQDSVGRDLANLRILIELARSEKCAAAAQQALAVKEAETDALSRKADELELANAALVRRVQEIRASQSTELQEQLQAALSQLQQLRADFEDKKVRWAAAALLSHNDASVQEQCDSVVRVRNFLVDELSGANLQLQAIHALHAQVPAALHMRRDVCLN